MKNETEEAMPTLLTLVAGKWSFDIVYALSTKTLRFNEVQKLLPNTTQKVLTETLRKLERSGMLARTVYPTIPPQVEYRLTALGLELLKLTGILLDWAEGHHAEIRQAQKKYDRG